jgi:hypothetical protein
MVVVATIATLAVKSFRIIRVIAVGNESIIAVRTNDVDVFVTLTKVGDFIVGEVL